MEKTATGGGKSCVTSKSVSVYFKAFILYFAVCYYNSQKLMVTGIKLMILYLGIF